MCHCQGLSDLIIRVYSGVCIMRLVKHHVTRAHNLFKIVTWNICLSKEEHVARNITQVVSIIKPLQRQLQHAGFPFLSCNYPLFSETVPQLKQPMKLQLVIFVSLVFDKLNNLILRCWLLAFNNFYAKLNCFQCIELRVVIFFSSNFAWRQISKFPQIVELLQLSP